MTRTTSFTLACILSATLAAACGDDDNKDDTKSVTSSGQWDKYAQPDAGANPAQAITGRAKAFLLAGNKTRYELEVAGLPPNRTFGAHVHKLTCAEMMAGGHYQHTTPPDGGSVQDPDFANNTNEVWLDFTTDGTGAGRAEKTVDFRPRSGEAKSIVVHAMMTNPANGTAGPKLACTALTIE